MKNTKESTTPIATSIPLSIVDNFPTIDASQFCNIVGALQYLTLMRLNIAFSVNRLAQFMHHPLKTHWTIMKWLICYLKGFLFHGLSIHKALPLTLIAFLDADWVRNRDDFKSIFTYVIYHSSTLIS